jgi:hypothetical protein
MSNTANEERAELGVLFVHGIGEQRPGRTVASFAAALYGWLFRWNCDKEMSPLSPTLSETVVSPDSGVDAEPARATLSVELRLRSGPRRARWLLAESWWADVFAPPRFLDLTQWVWKVSTCLLVLQFVIPMRRHWRDVRQDSDRRPLRLPQLRHALVAAGYCVLMGVAALLSVLLSIALLVLAVAAKLPIPRIDRAVQWVVVKLSAVLGDSYVLAHCPVQYAAMRTQVTHDLAWLEERCDKVVIVGHSQGAAIAHQVIKDGDYRKDRLRAFITLGQGISKLHLLRRMDWDPQARQVALRTRMLVTAGLFLAGLPLAGMLLSRWVDAAFEIPATFPLNVVLIGVGFLAIFLGVVQAIGVMGEEIERDFLLPGAGTEFSWIDYYASADPVSNGPLMAKPEEGSASGPARIYRRTGDQRPCDEIHNSGSILTDHNGYIRNQDQLVSKLLNDLVAAAYVDSDADVTGSVLVDDRVLTDVKRRRHRLVRWLVAGRTFAAAMGVALWWFNPAPLFKDPMNQVVQLMAPNAGMGDGLAQLVATVVLMAMFYVVAILLPWRVLERRSVNQFFHSANGGWQNTPGRPGSREKDGHTSRESVRISVSAGL